jgi:hypothetical protein
LKSSDTPRQSSEKLAVGKPGKVCLKEHISHYFTVFLRCSLAAGLKRLGQAARMVQRVVHGVAQRHIVQLGTTVKVAVRKDIATHHHCFRLTSGL